MSEKSELPRKKAKPNKVYRLALTESIYYMATVRAKSEEEARRWLFTNSAELGMDKVTDAGQTITDCQEVMDGTEPDFTAEEE